MFMAPLVALVVCVFDVTGAASDYLKGLLAGYILADCITA
jgi:hypothetical protein